MARLALTPTILSSLQQNRPANETGTRAQASIRCRIVTAGTGVLGFDKTIMIYCLEALGRWHGQAINVPQRMRSHNMCRGK